MAANISTGKFVSWHDVGINPSDLTVDFLRSHHKPNAYIAANGNRIYTQAADYKSGSGGTTVRGADDSRKIVKTHNQNRENRQNTAGEVGRTVPGANTSRVDDALGDDSVDVALSTDPHDPDNFVSNVTVPVTEGSTVLQRGDGTYFSGQDGGGGMMTVNAGADGQQVADESLGDQAVRAATNAGNSLVFDAFSESGQLNNLNGNEPTYVVYPESCGTDPECTQAVFFEFYYKKAPTVEQVTEFVQDAWGGAKAAFENVTSMGADIMDTMKNSSKPGSTGGSDASMGIGEAIANKTSAILGMLNEHMEGPEKEVSQGELTKDTRLSAAKEKSLDKLTLYMPQGLAINQATNYQDYDMGTLRNLMSGTGTLIPGIAKAAAGFVDDAASSLAGIELNTGAGINALTGTIKNPRKEMMFSGTEIRSFDFVFNFKPKSKKEAIAMVQAIKLLRFHSLPEINPSMSFLSVPSEVQVTFLDYHALGSEQGAGTEWMIENSVLPKLGRCAITSVNVTYQPEDNTIFEGGIPTMADVTITLTELEAIARNHVSELGM